MDNAKEWKYCVVGNIVREHLDENGIVRYGSKPFCGGTKVYLRGKYDTDEYEEIDVIGLNRYKKTVVESIPKTLIENVRRSRVYKETVLALMDNFEFYDLWWGDTEEDEKETRAYVKRWNGEK